MEKNSRTYRAYVQILKEELIPAMGCTEPIAIAYAAAKAREVLEAMPDRVEIGVSNNIIKNVKSVVVPNTDGLKGIEAAAAAGIVAGQADKALEVISSVTSEQKARLRPFLAQVPMHIQPVDNGVIFDIILTVYAGPHSVRVRIAQYHTNIVSIEKDGQVLLDRQQALTAGGCAEAPAEAGLTDKSLLTIADILDFADSCELDDIRPVLDTQIRYNTQISEEGLLGDYGANIGSTMLKFYGDDVRNRPSSSTPRLWPFPKTGCTGRWPSPTSSPSMKRAASGACRPTAAPSAPGAPPAAASPTCRGRTTRPSPTPWSMRWPSCRASSVTGPSPAAPPKSRPAWRRASWATICT